MDWIRIGIHEFKVRAFAGMNKTKFVEKYKGKLTVDINEVWDKIQLELTKIDKDLMKKTRAKKKK